MKPILISRLKFSVLLVSVLVLILISACTTEKILEGSELGDAAWQGKVEEVKTLLANGADVNLQDDVGRTALMRVSLGRKAEVVKILLDHGADVNLQDKFGDTALKHASRKGHKRVMELLKAAGAK